MPEKFEAYKAVKSVVIKRTNGGGNNASVSAPWLDGSIELDEVEAARFAVALLSAVGWLSAESAPRDGKPFIGVTNGRHFTTQGEVFILRFGREHWMGTPEWRTETNNAIHEYALGGWMPLYDGSKLVVPQECRDCRGWGYKDYGGPVCKTCKGTGDMPQAEIDRARQYPPIEHYY